MNPAFSDDATIEIDGLSKWFGPKVAVSNISCSFGPGVTGLLGPNGAGKTTTLRTIVGLLQPSEGSIKIHGTDPRTDPDMYRNLGLVPEEDAVYPFLTGRELAEYAARLTGVTDPAAAADRVIRLVALEDAADRPLSGYSKGMRQRAKVAAALVHDPDVIVLDEPLNGTDPVQRAKLITLFRELGDGGKTVIVSSHVLAEVERVANRVLAMVDGKLAAAGDVAAIRAALSDIPYRVHVQTDAPRRLAAALLEERAVHSVSIDGESVHVETHDLRMLGNVVAPAAKRLEASISKFEPEDESLESVFRYLVRRT
ncbi:MAG: ABC transporter ATP-binding protein [Acidimicrobiia bacterium]|nr:ABC transporter ATP-binding protein [Acidimicrobiia bacterium]